MRISVSDEDADVPGARLSAVASVAAAHAAQHHIRTVLYDEYEAAIPGESCGGVTGKRSTCGTGGHWIRLA